MNILEIVYDIRHNRYAVYARSSPITMLWISSSELSEFTSMDEYRILTTGDRISKIYYRRNPETNKQRYVVVPIVFTRDNHTKVELRHLDGYYLEEGFVNGW